MKAPAKPQGLFSCVLQEHRTGFFREKRLCVSVGFAKSTPMFFFKPSAIFRPLLPRPAQMLRPENIIAAIAQLARAQAFFKNSDPAAFTAAHKPSLPLQLAAAAFLTADLGRALALDFLRAEARPEAHLPAGLRMHRHLRLSRRKPIILTAGLIEASIHIFISISGSKPPLQNMPTQQLTCARLDRGTGRGV